MYNNDRVDKLIHQLTDVSSDTINESTGADRLADALVKIKDTVIDNTLLKSEYDAKRVELDNMAAKIRKIIVTDDFRVVTYPNIHMETKYSISSPVMMNYIISKIEYCAKNDKEFNVEETNAEALSQTLRSLIGKTPSKGINREQFRDLYREHSFGSNRKVELYPKVNTILALAYKTPTILKYIDRFLLYRHIHSLDRFGRDLSIRLNRVVANNPNLNTEVTKYIQCLDKGVKDMIYVYKNIRNVIIDLDTQYRSILKQVIRKHERGEYGMKNESTTFADLVGEFNSLNEAVNEYQIVRNNMTIGIADEEILQESFSNIINRVKDIGRNLKASFEAGKARRAEVRKQIEDNMRVANLAMVMEFPRDYTVNVYRGTNRPLVMKLPIVNPSTWRREPKLDPKRDAILASIPIDERRQGYENTIRSENGFNLKSIIKTYSGDEIDADDMIKIIYDHFLGDKVDVYPDVKSMRNNLKAAPQILQVLEYKYLGKYGDALKNHISMMERKVRENPDLDMLLEDIEVYRVSFSNEMRIYESLHDIVSTIAQESIDVLTEINVKFEEGLGVNESVEVNTGSDNFINVEATNETAEQLDERLLNDFNSSLYSVCECASDNYEPLNEGIFEDMKQKMTGIMDDFKKNRARIVEAKSKKRERVEQYRDAIKDVKNVSVPSDMRVTVHSASNSPVSVKLNTPERVLKFALNGAIEYFKNEQNVKGDLERISAEDRVKNALGYFIAEFVPGSKFEQLTLSEYNKKLKDHYLGEKISLKPNVQTMKKNLESIPGILKYIEVNCIGKMGDHVTDFVQKTQSMLDEEPGKKAMASMIGVFRKTTEVYMQTYVSIHSMLCTIAEDCVTTLKKLGTKEDVQNENVNTNEGDENFMNEVVGLFHGELDDIEVQLETVVLLEDAETKSFADRIKGIIEAIKKVIDTAVARVIEFVTGSQKRLATNAQILRGIVVKPGVRVETYSNIEKIKPITVTQVNQARSKLDTKENVSKTDFYSELGVGDTVLRYIVGEKKTFDLDKISPNSLSNNITNSKSFINELTKIKTLVERDLNDMIRYEKKYKAMKGSQTSRITAARTAVAVVLEIINAYTLVVRESERLHRLMIKNDKKTSSATPQTESVNVIVAQKLLEAAELLRSNPSVNTGEPTEKVNAGDKSMQSAGSGGNGGNDAQVVKDPSANTGEPTEKVNAGDEKTQVDGSGGNGGNDAQVVKDPSKDTGEAGGNPYAGDEETQVDGSGGPGVTSKEEIVNLLDGNPQAISAYKEIQQIKPDALEGKFDGEMVDKLVDLVESALDAKLNGRQMKPLTESVDLYDYAEFIPMLEAVDEITNVDSETMKEIKSGKVDKAKAAIKKIVDTFYKIDIEDKGVKVLATVIRYITMLVITIVGANAVGAAASGLITAAIGGYAVGTIVSAVDTVIEKAVNLNGIDETIKSFEKAIDDVNKKLENTELDNKAKKSLQQYKRTLENKKVVLVKWKTQKDKKNAKKAEGESQNEAVANLLSEAASLLLA